MTTTVGGNLTAGAIIAKELFRDTFTRTTVPSTPWASTDLGSIWELTYLQSGAQAWVDGSVLRVTAGKGFESILPESMRVSHGFVQFDFFVPANTSDSWPYWGVEQGSTFGIDISVNVNSGSTWGAFVRSPQDSTWAYVYFDPEPSTWYRVKGFYNGMIGGLLAVKIWKVSDPEPDAFGGTGIILDTADPWLDPTDWQTLYFYGGSPFAEPMAVDNFVIADYGAPFSPTKRASLTAGAVKRRTMPTKTAVMNAVIGPHSFSAGAWIAGGRSGHSRFWDHYGTEPDTVVVIDGPIGPYPSGTTVHAVLEDLVLRIVALESGNHVVLTFGAGAFIQPCLRANAVLFKTITYNSYLGTPLRCLADATIVRGKTNQPITLDATIIRSPETSFSASAYLIDLVC